MEILDILFDILLKPPQPLMGLFLPPFQSSPKTKVCCEGFKQNHEELIKIFRIMYSLGKNIGLGLLHLVLIVLQKQALLRWL